MALSAMGRSHYSVLSVVGGGHVVRECPSPGNMNWEELNQVEPAPVEIDPESKPSNQQ